MDTNVANVDFVVCYTTGPAVREAHVAGHRPTVAGPDGHVTAGGQTTRAAHVTIDGAVRAYLAVDCLLDPNDHADVPRAHLDPGRLVWDSRNERYYWPSPSRSAPELAPSHPLDGEPIAMVAADRASARVAVGRLFGYIRSEYLACISTKRHNAIVGVYDCDSAPGHCGSLVFTAAGVVGTHAGTLEIRGRQYNAFFPFCLGGRWPSPTLNDGTGAVRQSGRGRAPTSTAIVVHGADREARRRAGSVASRGSRASRASRASRGSRRRPRARREAVSFTGGGGGGGGGGGACPPRPAPFVRAQRREGIVSMSPAPSTLPLRNGAATSFDIDSYVKVLMNPWASPYMRLPDHVVVPTSLARFVKNSTITLNSCGTDGPNLLFGMCNRLSCYNSDVPVDTAAISELAAPPGTLAIESAYRYAPGNILAPLQWGLGGKTDPTASMAYRNYVVPASVSAGLWTDDFGASLRTTLPYMAAYRTLSMAMRVRVVGLPTGQFMTPGKIYFAQIRCDHADLPVTEQDFATLEQLGRATHVSADAVRDAGSKTVFYTPDGAQKFSMVTTFLPPCGSFGPAEWGASYSNPTGAGLRVFPSPYYSPGNAPVDFTRNIIPYRASGVSAAPGATYDVRVSGSASSPDAVNADATTYLFMAYFGAADNVVLEIDYATIVEYIPTKSAPGGVESMVQLPDSRAMDAVFSAAAVLAEARPVMLQQPGDLTLVASGRGMAPASREALSASSRLSSMAAGACGSAYREGFWDFDWLKKGSLGGGALSWDFSGGAPPPPSAPAAGRRLGRRVRR